MTHLSEEELIEQYYSKGADGLGEHLKDCAECAEAYAGLQSDLDEIEFAPLPEREGDYGEKIWQSIASSLPTYEARRRSWLGAGLWRTLSYAAACAVLVIGVFNAGRLWEHKQQGSTTASIPPKTQAPVAAPPPQRIVVVVLSDHLDRSERFLVELKHADADSEEMVSPLRDEARSLQAANRICREDAKKNDDPALTKALDRLDGVLAELANQPGGLNAAALARLQDEMKSDSLLFEVRVLRSRIPDRQRTASNRSEGDAI
jgi:hypothetical protein